mmetsp:Transcript_31776/g.80341  ORF Transcript_31776/g.80341 Transcript_31776/m.80341 type:complete len:294 (-) Transcript_31776:159-1040(-)
MSLHPNIPAPMAQLTKLVVPADIQHDVKSGESCCPCLAAPAHAILGQDSIKIDMEIKLPQVEISLPKPETVSEKVVKKPFQKKQRASQLSGIFGAHRCLEPVYFQSFDCIGFQSFFRAEECRRIIEHAEGQGFTLQRRHRMLNLQWADIVDPFFAETIWQQCGLEQFLGNVIIDGMRPCGLNDVIRIQKYSLGSVFGRHVDQHVKRIDGRISKYSLRVFLNSQGEGQFDGGLSAFHVPFRAEPVVVEPESGLALLYPQGEQCTPQEESEVVAGCKYVLRADILFARLGDGTRN